MSSKHFAWDRAYISVYNSHVPAMINTVITLSQDDATTVLPALNERLYVRSLAPRPPNLTPPNPQVKASNAS